MQAFYLAIWVYIMGLFRCTFEAIAGCINMFKIQKGYDSESKTFRLPVELIKRLEALAAQNKLSLNQLVIQCLNYSLDNLENEGKSKDK